MRVWVAELVPVTDRVCVTELVPDLVCVAETVLDPDALPVSDALIDALVLLEALPEGLLCSSNSCVISVWVELGFVLYVTALLLDASDVVELECV